MPQMKSADSGPITDSASTDSSIFELETSKSKSNEACYSGPLSEATSSSSVMSSVSADGLPSDLIARGPSSSSSTTQQSSSNLSLIPSLKELTMNEKLGANSLRSELHGFLCKVAGMEEQLLSLKKKLMHKQKYIGTLETNLKRIEGQNTNLKHEVSGLKKDNEDLRQRLLQSDTSGSLQALAAAQQKKSDRILSPMSQAREAQLGSELDKVLQENASLKQKIIGLEQELSETVKRLDHTRQRQEQRCKEMESLLLHATKELQNVETERDEVAQLLAEVVNKNSGSIKDETLKSQFENLLFQKPAVTAKELTTIKDRLFAAHKQIDCLEKDFREEHEQRLTAERDLARMKAAVRDLERDCDTLRLQVQFLQEDFYREHEDKKVLERTIRMRENANSLGAERNWHKTENYPVQEHEYTGKYERSPVVENAHFRFQQPPQPKPRTFHHHHSILPYDIECDSSQAQDKKPVSDLQKK